MAADHNTRYGWPHRRMRARLAQVVASGRAVCARCGQPVLPGSRWDLGHVDGGGPRDYSGVEHARCNRGAPNRRRPLPDEPAPDVIRSRAW